MQPCWNSKYVQSSGLNRRRPVFLKRKALKPSPIRQWSICNTVISAPPTLHTKRYNRPRLQVISKAKKTLSIDFEFKGRCQFELKLLDRQPTSICFGT